ncbi:MAG: pectate lyase [Planctomycetota bacterium]
MWRESLDGATRDGERAAGPDEIWVQPPGTPSVGLALLALHAATGDDVFLTAARGAGHALARGQLASGGWEYSIDFTPDTFTAVPRAGETARRGQRAPDSTLDDDTTQSALRFLLALADVVPDDEAITRARDRALDGLLAAQLPCGAWPQRFDGRPVADGAFSTARATIPADWPRTWPRPDYKKFATLNDNALRDCVGVLLDAHRRLGRDDCRAAALRAGEFLIRAQLPEPQPAWAQQYDSHLHPAWARSFEPPAVTAGESAGAVRTLLDLFVETGDGRFLEPIPRAIAWWRRSEIAPGTWARYYELGTNRPIYGDRDGTIHHDIGELSAERRDGYAWQGSFGVADTIRAYDKLRDGGRDAALAHRASPSRDARAKRARELGPKVHAALDSLDERGIWLTAPERGAAAVIDMKVVVRQLPLLAEYLAATAP